MRVHHNDKAATTLCAGLGLICVVVLLAVYACWLNQLYYGRNGPFLDSLAYCNQLAEVLTQSRLHGFIAGVHGGDGSTVVLPWIVASAAACVLPVSRLDGVWFQAALLLPLLFSLYYFFRRVAGFSELRAFAAVFPFVAIHAALNFDGGLSDFRLDLSLYILFSLTCIWCFLAMAHRRSVWPWVICGLCGGLAALARATAPAYLVVALGPVIVARLAHGRGRRAAVIGSMIAIFFAAIVCGWFFIVRFSDLHSYYFVWNRNAHAHVPFLKALALHGRAAGANIGWPAALLALSFGFGQLFAAGRTLSFWRFLRSVNWAMLYVGVAPILLLAAQGSGPNPFVSMPAAFGLLLWLIFPLRRKAVGDFSLFHLSPIASVTVAVIVTAGVAVSAIGGHLRGQGCMNLMSGQRGVVDRMLADAGRRHATDIRFTTFQLGAVHSETLRNAMIYEYGFQAGAGSFSRNGLTVANDPVITEPSEWQQVDGVDDAAKIRSLVARAGDNDDYLILPDPSCLNYLELHGFKCEMNLYAGQFREAALAGGQWQEIGCPIVVSPVEIVEVYRNRAR